MNKFYFTMLLVIMLIASLFTGCDTAIVSVNTPTPEISPTPSASDGITTDVSPSLSPQVTTDALPSPTITTDGSAPSITTEKEDDYKDLMKEYLPPFNKTLRYFGIAETGHIGEIVEMHDKSEETLYEFRGTYNDGYNDTDKFVVRYYFNYKRNTITEQVVSTERRDFPEIYSKMHNIVVLKFPLSLGTTWKHSTTVNGVKLTVHAKVIEYTNDLIKVRYEVPGAKGYYKDTYLEERTFEKGYGLTAFSNLIQMEIPFDGIDMNDKEEVEKRLMEYMFGYVLNRDSAK